jgi:hypothetical protein
MTLVASFQGAGLQVMIADVLTTWWHADSESHVQLPSTSTVDVLVGSGKSFDCRQKIALITDQLAVGWSGSVPIARALIKQLEHEIEPGPVERKQIDGLLCAFKQELAYSELSILAMAVDNSGVTWTFGQNIAGHQEGILAPCWSIGTGRGDFLRDAKSFARPLLLEGPSQFQALSTAHAIFGRLLLREMHSLSTESFAEFSENSPLWHDYGGLYETAYSADGRIQKADDLTLWFWRAEREGDILNLDDLAKVVRIAYVGKSLIARWADCKRSGENLDTVAEGCFSIGPITELVGYSSLPQSAWPTISARFEGHTMLIEAPQTKRRVFSWLRMPDARLGPVANWQTEVGCNSPKATIERRVISLLMKAALQAFADHGPLRTDRR